MRPSNGLIGFCRLIIHKFHKNAIKSETTVYRAITKSSWWEGDTDTPKYDIFFRTVDEEDFSILTRSNCESSCDGGFNTCYGEVSLEAKTFIIKGFRVISTPRSKVPHHASVYGMPPEDEATARSIALDLLECVTDKKRRRYKTKKIKK